MREVIFTPVHQETGLVLPVILTPEDFTLSKNRHQHHVVHPCSRAEVQDQPGKIVRSSRTQELPNHMHFNTFVGGYHRIFYGPKNVPEDEATKIRMALLHIAGVIPREGIVLEPFNYETRRLNDAEHHFLSHPEITHIEGRNPRQRQFAQAKIGFELTRYAVNQDLRDIVSPKTANQFMNTVDHKREKELGNLIVCKALDEVVNEMIPIYEKVKAEGMVDPARLGIRAIVRNFSLKQDFGNFHQTIRSQLDPESLEFDALQTGVDEVQLAA